MYTCIFSYPRQGTDWLMKCLGHEKNENGRKGYFREYFNLIVNRRRAGFLRSWNMGTEVNSDDIFTESCITDLEHLLGKTWKRDGIKMTKENFCYSKIPAFVHNNFDCFIMYRHRKYTFPTSRPDYVIGIYESFLKRKYSVDSFNTLRDFCKEELFEHKIILSHIIAFVFMFYYAQKYNLQVLNYEELITEDKVYLIRIFRNIECNISWQYINTPEQTVDNIVSTRMTNLQSSDIKLADNDLQNRIQKYKALNCEHECERLISFVEKLGILEKRYIDLLL